MSPAHPQPDDAMRRWRPSPAIRASAALHVAGAAALLAVPSSWPWVLGAIVADHALLTAAGLWPRSTLLGPNMLRLPPPAIARREIALTFDDGPDAALTPRVLDLLDRYRAKASFFCVGRKAAAHAGVVRETVRRGHSVENHSDRHSNFFSFYGLRGLRREIEAAQAAIAQAAGTPPLFFRAPAGLRSPLLDPVVARLGLRYVAWTRRGFDTVSGDSRKVLDRLVIGLAAGDILLLHDGGCAPTRGGHAVVLEVLPALLERILAAGFVPVSLRAAMRCAPR
ncbi:MAG TPA: polysaccharide deacetylase family protein [Burkholderiales bacterium]|nr:polysaccharide deacetylase family protein [Burkholderiales bacterium]